MKRFKIISSIIISMILVAVIAGCDEDVSLSVEGRGEDSPFTFEPKHGYPGMLVKIEGQELSDVTKVSFESKAVVAEDFMEKTDASISILIPVGARSGRIILVKGTTILTSATDFTVDDSPTPAMTEFAPVIVGSDQPVIIKGSTLDKVIKVEIGDLVATIIEQKDTLLTITTPSGMQTGKIKLYYNYMTSYGIEKEDVVTSDADLTLELPSIVSITSGGKSIAASDNWLNIGDEVVITGTMMDEITEVKFGDVIAVIGVATSETLTITVPSGAIKGKITLTVPDGTTESEAEFKVDLPTILSFTPNSGMPGSDDRIFSLQGERLSTVNAVKVGDTYATISSKTDNVLIFTVGGGASGDILLETSNGNVQSSLPFYFVGDFWVNDWDNTFEVSRFGSFANRNLGSFSEATANDAASGNYAELTMGGAIHDKGFYIWGTDNGTNDRFSLFTSNPNGVYLEFDLKVSSIADELKQTDGTFKFKIFMMDALGWDASGESSYGSNSPTSYVQTNGEWQHFKIHLADFVASGNGGLYTADQVDGTAGAFCHPNSLRIIAFVFGTTNESGEGEVVFGMDNLKFSIE
ncbi:MAG: IPT/TIG domain-containing protein [Labilibaculum sp.]|nr:IPT/TIG domain-containing protein [Labilibaculum sp.]